MKSFLVFLFLCFAALSADPHCAVFVHIGPKIPAHAEYSLLQMRLFNPNIPIIVLANQEAIDNFNVQDSNANITYIACESLKRSKPHQQFLERTTFHDSFWRFASERFLYLDELISQHRLSNVFHLENDVMIYAQLQELLPILKKYYQGIAATYNNDDVCIPGFVFIPNPKESRLLARCFAEHAGKRFKGHTCTDMDCLAIFRQKYGSAHIDMLPTTMAEYAKDHPLVSQMGHRAADPALFSQHSQRFQAIFDAAALGQYLGGIDPIHHWKGEFFINERCIFNPSFFTYSWELDEQARRIPYITYKNRKMRINNLHIHCKDTKKFASKQWN